MLIRDVARRFDLSVVRARSVMRAALFHFVLVWGITAFKISTNALYLARRDPKNLPYLYLATAIVITVVSLFVARKLGHMSAKPVLRQSLTFTALVIFGLSVLAALDVGPSLAALYVLGEAYATALSVLFWARLGEVFDVRAQKRVFGVLSAAGMAGCVIAGLLARALAGVVPSLVWCFIAAATLLAIRPLLGPEQAPGPVRRDRVGVAKGIEYVAKFGYPKAVAALVLMISVQTAAIDFLFRTSSHRFVAGDEAQMAGLFGTLNAVVGLLAILVQTTLTARLLQRLGVFAYLAIVPLVCLVAAGSSLALPALLLPVFMLKVFEMMGSFSLNQPGLQLLYNPMPDQVRGSVRAVIDGTVKKVGGALGGVVLLLAAGGLDLFELTFVVIGIAVLVLLGIRLVRPMYVSALESKLGGRELTKTVAIDAQEKSTRNQLIKALEHGTDVQTLAAIELLGEDLRYDFKRHIGALISHPSESVRLKAIELIERAPDRSYAPFLESVVLSPGRHPRASAARALMLVAPERGHVVLEPILRRAGDTEDRALVAAAAVALLGRTISAPPEGRGRSVESLAEAAIVGMVERALAGTPSDKRELANVLAMIGPGRFAPSLVPLLRDKHPGVRTLAVEAAIVATDDALPPVLVELLSDRRLARKVREALVAHGDRTVPLLARTLDLRSVEVTVRVQVPRVLREIGTPQAAQAMLFSNKDDDAYLRYVIIEELVRLRRNKPEIEFDRAYTEAAILRRLKAYAWYRPIAADLSAAGPAYALLHRAMADRVKQNLEAALRVLGLLYDPRTLENVEAALVSQNKATQGDALEMLDVAIQGSGVRAEVLAYVEPPPPIPVGERAEERAFELVESRDTRLAVIAHETLRRLGKNPPPVREPTTGDLLMAKSIIDKVFLLQGVQLFRGLPVDDLSAVASITTEGHAEPREVIYEQGQRGDSLYVIVAGEIHLLRSGKALLDLTVGESFGQTSILDGGPRPVTAKAGDEGCDYVRLERQPLMDLMADRPELMSGLFIELAARIRELIELTEGQGKPGASTLVTRTDTKSDGVRPAQG